jgi:DNA-binding protein H-NS
MALAHAIESKTEAAYRRGRLLAKRGQPTDRAERREGSCFIGRGRMPRWMAAATKGGKVKQEDFLVE